MLDWGEDQEWAGVSIVSTLWTVTATAIVEVFLPIKTYTPRSRRWSYIGSTGRWTYTPRSRRYTYTVR